MNVVARKIKIDNMNRPFLGALHGKKCGWNSFECAGFQLCSGCLNARSATDNFGL